MKVATNRIKDSQRDRYQADLIQREVSQEYNKCQRIPLTKL